MCIIEAECALLSAVGHFSSFSPTLFGLKKKESKKREQGREIIESKMASKIQFDQRMKRLNDARNVLKIQLDQHKKRMDALDSLYGETPSDELRSGYCKSIFCFRCLL